MSDDFIRRVLIAMKDFNDSLMWSVMGDDIQFMVDCSDVFEWGTADGELLTEENIQLLEETIVECQEVFGYKAYWSIHLFVARQRKMRPQGAYYKYFDKGWHSLFDAVGPQREQSVLNPGMR